MSEPDEPAPSPRVSAATVQDGPRARTPRPVDAPAPVASVFDPPAERFAEAAELGRGGMGRVVAAQDRALDRPVAIKHLLATSAADLARFEREVRLTARLSHPGIVPILDAGRGPDGQPYYIMRKIDGEPLADRVKRAADVRERLALVPAVLGAIDAAAYAHARGVLHRDIKPWNILVGPYGEALLIDWGLARELDDPDDPTASLSMRAASAEPGEDSDSLTRVGVAYGTPGFMAPEQARGEPVDRRADVYSLGATLFFVLAGELPFATATPTAAIEQAAADHAPDLARLPRDISADLAAIVGKALATDRAARYADAGELASDLRRFLAGQLVAAHVYSPRERLVRWLRERRLAVAIAAVAVVAITATAAVSIRRVITERDSAERAQHAAELAQHVAEERAEDNLIERASLLVTRDPTSAVALLRGLPASSPRWAAAGEIVRAAVASGVERALPTQHGAGPIALADDDQRVASIGEGGAVEICALDGSGLRELGNVAPSAGAIAWLDANTLVAWSTYDATSIVIDATTGAVRPLPVPGIEQVLVDGGRIYARTSDGAVFGFDHELHRVVYATAGATSMDVRNGRLVAAGNDRALVFEGNSIIHERVFAPRLGDSPRGVKLSASGDRIAFALDYTVLEWELASSAPPRRFPQKPRVAFGFDYVGDELWVMSGDGTGARTIAPDGTSLVSRWHVRGEFLPLAPFSGGAVLAMSDGRIAYTDRFGLVVIPHRAMLLQQLAVTRDGKRVVLSTVGDELLVLDLRAMRPDVVSPPGTTVGRLAAARGDAFVAPVLGAQSATPGETQTAYLFLPGRPPQALPGLDDISDAAILGHRVAGCSVTSRQCGLWTEDGQVAWSTPAPIGAIQPGLAGGTSVFYATPAGDLVEQPLTPDGELGPARTLDHIPPRHMPGFDMTPIWTLTTVDHRLLVGLFPPVEEARAGLGRYFALYDGRSPAQPVPVAGSGVMQIIGRTSDGAWWSIADAARLVRTTDGEPRTIALDTDVQWGRMVGDRVWVFGREVVYVVTADGTVVHRARISSSGGASTIDDREEALGTPDGIEIVEPELDQRRLLPLPAGVSSIVSNHDHAVLGSTLEGDAVVRWRDPVPRDPAALPAYIAALTNAHLVIGNDALAWK